MTFGMLQGGGGNVRWDGTGFLGPDGSYISSPASYTWAQFTDAGFDLTTARFVYVSDKHSTRDASATPGSLWRIVPTASANYKRQLVSEALYISTRASVPSVSSYPGIRVFIADEGYGGMEYVSDGTYWRLCPTGEAILHRDGVQGTIAIQPAATFTSATPSSAAAGADTLLTSAGVHGLTSAVAVGASIYISAGTGWTVGWHAITAIAVDTTGVTIQIDTPYNAGFGTPTISLVGTELTLKSVTVPVMTPTGALEIDTAFGYTSNASDKVPKIQLNTTAFYAPAATTNVCARPTPLVIRNRGATNSQVGSFASANAAGNGTNGTAPPTGTVDTSVSTTLKWTAQPAAANLRVWVEYATVKMRT